jgi:hypothetical protein
LRQRLRPGNGSAPTTPDEPGGPSCSCASTRSVRSTA